MKYNTKCPYCNHPFNISTGKTRYNEYNECFSCKGIALYSLTPENGKIVMTGRKLSEQLQTKVRRNRKA